MWMNNSMFNSIYLASIKSIPLFQFTTNILIVMLCVISNVYMYVYIC